MTLLIGAKGCRVFYGIHVCQGLTQKLERRVLDLEVVQLTDYGIHVVSSSDGSELDSTNSMVRHCRVVHSGERNRQYCYIQFSWGTTLQHHICGIKSREMVRLAGTNISQECRSE